jgi:hypothetical protein
MTNQETNQAIQSAGKRTIHFMRASNAFNGGVNGARVR